MLKQNKTLKIVDPYSNREIEIEMSALEPQAQRSLQFHSELVRKLEDCRAFIMRFDDPDKEEIKMSREISELLEKCGGKNHAKK